MNFGAGGPGSGLVLQVLVVDGWMDGCRLEAEQQAAERSADRKSVV